ncbi:peptide deformylase [Zavarzinia compransoris]|uniref:Peptide deformylase n=1 Tax=Zavarzinia compransoris TaxID=1264899 RepID=A0A317DXN7_9PROT|nr:peptide deformylase [Zavarzinia compransoris]PWR18710.1 peptide deformylase [Zavarzinia compransoris]TDP48689.1 peptide deformylase [Zavarzinia compransoris]
MAIRPILIAPDPRLKQKSTPVEAFDADLQGLIDDMFETMYDAPGIGLAAIQVGVPKRLLVIDLAREDEDKAPRVFINPEITWKSDEEISTYEEGCLSVPEQYAEVQRPARVRVSYLDREGKAHEDEMDGLLATCIQHEMDHLEGVLFVDHLSFARRGMLMRKLAKARKFAKA